MPENEKESDNQSTPASPLHEHPSTYFVQDRSNLDEMTRLRLQDHMTTTMMGGLLPEQSEPGSFESVLDVACGTGGWLIEAAKTYPTIKRLVGVDISSKMLDYAREQAAAQGVGDHVEFYAMDALRLLEFPDNTFDLVNQRFGASFLRKWDWPNILREYVRVCKAGGVLRITESNMIGESSSPALVRLSELLWKGAFAQAGHLFTSDPDGVTSQLVSLLHKWGILNVQTRSHTLYYRAGTPEGQLLREDMSRVFQVVVPFIRKWTRIPDDYNAIYQQMLDEFQQPDFVTRWDLLTAWGTVPE